MSSPNHPPSGGTANAFGPVGGSEDVGVSFVLWLAAVVIETVDVIAPPGS